MVPTKWPPRRVGWTDVGWTDQLRMIWKARPCGKLTGMIDVDLVPISHVSGSLKLDGSLHEVITIVILGHRGDARQCSVLFFKAANGSM